MITVQNDTGKLNPRKLPFFKLVHPHSEIKQNEEETTPCINKNLLTTKSYSSLTAEILRDKCT